MKKSFIIIFLGTLFFGITRYSYSQTLTKAQLLQYNFLDTNHTNIYLLVVVRSENKVVFQITSNNFYSNEQRVLFITQEQWGNKKAKNFYETNKKFPPGEYEVTKTLIYRAKNKEIWHSIENLKVDSEESAGVKKEIANSNEGVDSLVKQKLKKIKLDSLFDFSRYGKGKLKISGTIDNNYQYGLQAFNLLQTKPEGSYLLQGNGIASYGILPITYDFQYTTLKSYIGIPNYFHARLDVNQLKANVKNEIVQQKDKALKDLHDTRNEKDKLAQQVNYNKSKYSKGNLEKNNDLISDYEKKAKELVKDSLFLAEKMGTNAFDTLSSGQRDSAMKEYNKRNREIQKTLAYYEKQKALLNEYNSKFDSVQKSITENQNKISKLQNKEDSIQKITNDKTILLDAINSGKSMPYSLLGHYKNYVKYQTLLKIVQTVKRFDIGLCNPDFSPFLINGTPIRGFQLELEPKGFYLGMAAGKTVVNNQANLQKQNNNPILGRVKNAYNYFDFNDTLARSTIYVIKGGYGTKEKTHFYLGYLYGGRTLDNDSFVKTYQRNGVLEGDLRLVINTKTILDAIYATSGNLYSQDKSEHNSFDTWSFNRSNDSLLTKYALLLKTTTEVGKTHTKITLNYRVVQPNFKSLGASFLIADNRRYEIKINQGLGSKLKLSIFYRIDEDNLLNNKIYKNTVNMAGVTLQYKPMKRLQIVGTFMPAYQLATTADSLFPAKRETTNYIAQGAIVYVTKSKKLPVSYQLRYGYYKLNQLIDPITPIINQKFQNASLSQLLILKRNKTLTNTLQWFYQHNNEETEFKFINDSSTHTAMVESAFNFILCKKLMTQVAARGSWQQHMAENARAQFLDYGFLLGLQYPITAWAQAQVKFERMLKGDFLSGYNQELLKEHPYFFSADIKILF